MTRADYKWSGIANSAAEARAWCERRCALSWEEFAEQYLQEIASFVESAQMERNGISTASNFNWSNISGSISISSGQESNISVMYGMGREEMTERLTAIFHVCI